MKRFFLVFLLIILFLFGGFLLFWSSGGAGILRLIYSNNLHLIPNSDLVMQDFVDRDPRKILSGYFVFADKKWLYLWTLSGLKRFSHLDNVSFYSYVDVCGLLDSGADPKKFNGSESIFFTNLSEWAAMMKTGNLIGVLRVDNGRNREVIDRAINYNSKYLALTNLTSQQCK